MDRREQINDADLDAAAMAYRAAHTTPGEMDSEDVDLADAFEAGNHDLGVDDAARHYLLHEHRSPLNAIMHEADLKAEMTYHKDIEKAFKAGVKWRNDHPIVKSENQDLGVDDAARHYLLHEHRSPLSAIMHEADLKAEMTYHKDIENAFKAGVKWRNDHPIVN